MPLESSSPTTTRAAEKIAAAVRQLLRKHTPRVLIALDGPSGSGKSTLAQMAAQALDATVVESDDFFAGEITDDEWGKRPPSGRAATALDWRRLRIEVPEIGPFVEGGDQVNSNNRVDISEFRSPRFHSQRAALSSTLAAARLPVSTGGARRRTRSSIGPSSTTNRTSSKSLKLGPITQCCSRSLAGRLVICSRSEWSARVADLDAVKAFCAECAC